MQVQAHPIHQSWTSYAISIGIIIVVMALRMREWAGCGRSSWRPCGSCQ